MLVCSSASISVRVDGLLGKSEGAVANMNNAIQIIEFDPDVENYATFQIIVMPPNYGVLAYQTQIIEFIMGREPQGVVLQTFDEGENSETFEQALVASGWFIAEHCRKVEESRP